MPAWLVVGRKAWIVAMSLILAVAGCMTPLRSKTDPAFLKKVANDPFPSAAEKGLLSAPEKK